MGYRKADRNRDGKTQDRQKQETEKHGQQKDRRAIQHGGRDGQLQQKNTRDGRTDKLFKIPGDVKTCRMKRTKTRNGKTRVTEGQLSYSRSRKQGRS